MASRIAVMSHGKVVQVGTPKEIYESPSSRFVADFIGNINIFDGRINASSDVQAAVQTDIGVIHIVNALPHGQGGAVAVAIRPEKINIAKSKPMSSPNLFNGSVREIGYLGSYTSFLVEMAGGKTIRVNTINHAHEPGLAGAEITWGDKVYVWWDTAASVVLTQ